MASNKFNSRRIVIVIFFKKEIVLKIFLSGEYKNADFLRLSFRVLKLYSFESRVCFWFWLVMQCSLALCDGSKGDLPY